MDSKKKISEYAQYIPTNGCTDWYEERVKELGKDKLLNFVNFVYKKLMSLPINGAKTFDSFKAADKKILIQICYLAVEESKTAQKHPQYNFIFDEECTKIIRIK